MGSTVGAFEALLTTHGSDVIYHRDDSTTPCPCLTPEGFRDPEWHDANPAAPVCNERGFLPSGPLDVHVKAMMQPVISRRGSRLTSEYMEQMFGVIERDDHFGIFPFEWGGTTLNFDDWSQSGEDYVLYDGRKFMVVNGNAVPDPGDGNPHHHWELGLRLVA